MNFFKNLFNKPPVENPTNTLSEEKRREMEDLEKKIEEGSIDDESIAYEKYGKEAEPENSEDIEKEERRAA